MSYKVVQWATGDMGKSCLRAILHREELELVGVYVYSDAKAGRDAGDIARRAATGVIATDKVADILALDADVVVHAPRLQSPRTHHNDNICQLLASGKNVISINGDTFPHHWGTECAAQFETACQEGNSSLFGTGLNPGFISEKLVAELSGVCSRIDRIAITEVLQCNQLDSPQYAFDVLGFGSEIGAIDPNDVSFAPAGMVNGLFFEVVHELVDRLGFKLDRIDTEHKMLPATKDIRIPAGTIRQGTNSHTSWCWHAIVDGERFLTMSIHWIMEVGHLENPDFALWHVRMEGIPGIDLSLDLVPSDERVQNSGSTGHGVEFAVGDGVAGSVVNSIPWVCDSPAGILRVPITNHYRRSGGRA